MNKYKRLLGSSRGSHFRESGRRLRFSTNRRRQSVKFRRRYAESVMQGAGKKIWAVFKIVFVIGAAVWILGWGIHLFRTTTFFNAQAILFEGNPPTGLKTFLPFKPGQNLFSVKPHEWEKKVLEKFPEIKTVAIERTPFRNIAVHMQVREPLALLAENEILMGVDEEGVVFPLGTTAKPVPSPFPRVRGKTSEERGELVGFLENMKAGAPDLYSQIEQAEYVKEGLRLSLRGDIFVEWGMIDEKNMFEKAKNILRLLKEVAPKKGPAVLSFVTDDRIVMDSNWILLAPK